MTDINCDADSRVDAVGARGGAAQAHFLLYRGHAINGGLERPPLEKAQSFHDDPKADLVIHAGRDGHSVAQLAVAQRKSYRIAVRDERFGFLSVLGADIEPNIRELWHFGALVGRHEV